MPLQCQDSSDGPYLGSALCIEQDLILTFPLTVLVFVALVQIGLLPSAHNRHVSSNSLSRLRVKLILLGLAYLISLTTLAFIIFNSQPSIIVNLPHALEPLALFLALYLTIANHRRSRSSSIILLLFWPCYALALLVWTRSYVQTFPLTPLVPLKWAVVFIGLLSFALECISPDDSFDPITENPTLTANVFSIWSFSWITPLLRKGYQVTVAEDDLAPLVPYDESANLGNNLECAIKKHSGLYAALFVAYGGPYLCAGLLKLLQDTLVFFVQPLLLNSLLACISEFQDYNHGTKLNAGPAPLYGYGVAALMFATAIAQTTILHQYFDICIKTGMRVRAGLVTAIYKKSLVLSSQGRSRSTGDIVNLMSVDVTRLQEFCTIGLMIFSVPYQLILAFVSLYNLLGWSAFVGVVIMLFSIPMTVFMARVLKLMQVKLMKDRDMRTRLMSELLVNIKSIKLYGWEYAFIRRVLRVRNNLELKMLRSIYILSALNTALWSGIPLIIAFGSIAAASMFSEKPLTAEVIFPATAVLMHLSVPLAMSSQLVSNIMDVLVSIRRISDFLYAEELQNDAVIRFWKRPPSVGQEVLSIKGGDFFWIKNGIQPTLEGINLTVRKGELIGILGRVGAGKSSLLYAIIGEMQKTQGEVVVSGSVAYATQNPWILSTTVRDNILFSHAYEESFYNLVIEACALKPDLAALPQGDMTEVGEKGIALSGGQRARIALARAVYARADLVLLDDVLAAVDSHVARLIFENVIGPRGLLATKARILVTNSIAHLKHFDQIAYMRRGILLECGSYQDLVSIPHGEIRNIVKNHATSGSPSGESSITTTPSRSSGSGSALPMPVVTKLDLAEKLDRRASFSEAVIAPLPSIRKQTSSESSKEHCERGRVKLRVYLQYLRAASRAGFCFFVLVTVLGQLVTIASTTVLRLWNEANRASSGNAGLMDPYLLGYGLLNLASVALTAAAGLLISLMCSLRSSKYLHDSMLDSIMRAPLSFFETTPIGRILNLFSRDLYGVDMTLGNIIRDLGRSGASCAFILLAIGSILPPFLLGIVPLAWLYFRVTAYYLTTSRDLHRLDAASRTPIFAWFSDSLQGLSTIRAYGHQAEFTAQNAQRIDRNQTCYLAKFTVDRWVCVRLGCIGALVVLCTALLAISAVATRRIDVGVVGVVLTYAMSTTDSLNWLVRSASELEQTMVSVERIVHCANEIPSEGPREVQDGRAPAGWPTAGEVSFCAYSMAYRPELEPVLQNISLTIRAKEKIGIVGRTGAGKSSLLLALFRILEAASGKILIDGVDISTIGLHELRSAISIVPQSPDMFEGTIRDNMDPVGEYDDADIWMALEHAHLKSYVERLPETLETLVQEGGSSLSAGQRQQFCFARALLRKSKVLVLDEATSAVDLDTDAAMQEIIHGHLFRDVTMLTIAHRLNTIMASDRVLVLERGRVVEFDAPGVLLADKTSRFYAMALEAGLMQDASGDGQA